MALLSIEELRAGYGADPVVDGLSLACEQGEITALLGANGAGKTTTLRAVMGLLEPTAGTIKYDDTDITGAEPHELYRHGISLVSEDRGIFPELTVEENLRVPTERPGPWDARLEERFPELVNRRETAGKHLSGGEQQLLAIARALRRRPELLLLDEPSEGLAPQVIERVIGVIRELVSQGTTILLVEQNIEMAFEMASRGYLIDKGQLILSGSMAELKQNDQQIRSYVGVSFPY